MHAHNDALWGEIPLDEPVIRELVESQPLQRLKGIAQAGASAYLFPEKANITRFDHSVGVMYILLSLGATVEEQIAGLLHDVPHTAFSHTIDIAFPSADYTFHEKFHHDIVMKSEIPSILSQHGIGIEAALEPGLFPLLEQPLPALCADRIDYALRDRHASGHLSSGEVRDFLSHLVAGTGGIEVDGVEPALWFASHFAEANRTSWTSPSEAGAYWALAQAIKRGVELGCLKREDLFTTDAEVMALLTGLDDPLVLAYLTMLEPGTAFFSVPAGGPYFETHMKQRVVDPFVRQPGGAQSGYLSRISPDYGRFIANVAPTGTLTYRLWSDKMPAIVERSLRDLSSGETPV